MENLLSNATLPHQNKNFAMSPAQEGPNKNIVITEMRCSLLGGVVVYWEGQNYEYVL